MIILEKMLFLKTMLLFKFTPEEVLLDVAGVVEEKTFSENELIMQKGDLGTEMYMIVKGKVKVHDGDHFLAEIGERDVFGELAALSPDKRTASVTALEESLFLTISHDSLYDLMEAHIGLAKGIIHVLCSRLRVIETRLAENP